MGLPIDPLTVYLALVASTAAAVLLLLWCYFLNRGEKSLLWLAVGFLLSSVANFLFGIRGDIPDWVAVDFGVSVLLLGLSCIWCAARAFNGKPIPFWTPLAVPVLWLLLCRVPVFYADLDARLVGATVFSAACYFVGAREFLVRDGLVARYAVASALAVHGVLVLLRIPFVVSDDKQGLASFEGSPWFGVATLEAVIFIQVIAFLMVSLTKERVESRLRAAALTDALTGLGNRRAFYEWGEAAIARGERNGAPVAAILFDLDRFKEINDRYGHPVGDAVIQAFASVARNRIRAGDFVARLGGEEFAVALPDTTGPEACLVAIEVGQAFETAVAAFGPDGLTGTACAGVAATPAAFCTLQDLLSAADRALYQAKALGRGQVRLNEETAPQLRVAAA
ncbi:MAG TPA: GGDEF domain-containing protein [Bauldia sp.]|nr:GGDEF domain-containing protein [Bauldia sp.]